MSHPYYNKLIAAAFALLSFYANAQDVIPTKGREFWVGFMQNYANEPQQESLDIFITSDQSTNGIVEIPQLGWSTNFTVTANQTTTVTVPNSLAEHYSSEIVESKGVRIATADTVSVFAINFNAYSADGTKVLPIPSLGTDYRISSYPGQFYGSELVIVATEDDTEIEITPTSNTAGGNIAGQPFTVQLNRGESYQVKASSGTGDLTGTRIVATENSGECRPFAVFSGTGCANVYSACGACDHIFDQNFPVKTWGHEFFIVPFSFANGYTYRVLAHQDNTVVTIDNGLPIGLNAGQFVEFNNVNDSKCIVANNGISVIQYMQGITCSLAGDPAMMILNDASQQIDQITFSTVDSNVITEHGLNIIIATASIAELLIDGNGVNAGLFTPFAANPDMAYAQITISEGSHTISASSGFTAYAYGTGDAESYAYSVGSFASSEPTSFDQTLCTSSTLDLAANPSLSDVVWYIEGDPNTPVGQGNQLTLVPPIVTNVYIAVGSTFPSGCDVSEYFLVESSTPPEIVLTGSDDSICKYQEVQLSASVNPPSAAYVFTWDNQSSLNDPTAAQPIATPLETTTYNLSVTTPSGCASSNAEFTIQVSDGQIIDFGIEPINNIVCGVQPTTLQVGAEQMVITENFDQGVGSWATISNATVTDVCGSVSGNALYFNGAGNRVAITNPLDLINGGTIRFSVKIASESFPCDDADPGEDIAVEYTTNGSGGPWVQLMMLNENLFDDWTAVQIDIPAAAQTNATRLRWRQLSNSGNNQDNWAIDDLKISVTANTTFDFEWSPNIALSSTSSPSVVVSPAADQTYYVEMTDPVFGCTYLDSISIDVGQPFSIDLPQSLPVCDADGVLLDGTIAGTDSYTYFWSGQQSTIDNIFSPTPTIVPQNTGVYNLSVSSSQGCTADHQIELVLQQLHTLSIDTDQTNICFGAAVALTGQFSGNLNDVVVSWSPNADIQDPSALVTAATPESDVTYLLSVTDIATGCMLSQAIDIHVFQAFSIDAGEDLAMCSLIGNHLQPTATSNQTLDWSWEPANNFENPNIQNAVFETDQSGLYSVTAMDAEGCVATDSLQIEILFPPFDIGPDLSICFGTATSISTGLDQTYLHTWSNGEATPEIEISQAGTYTVQVEAPNGCVRSDQITLTSIAAPTVNLGDDIVACDGENIALNAGSDGETYMWNTGETTSILNVTNSGTYSVTVTNGAGCSWPDVVSVLFNETPQISLPDTLTLCDGESMLLDLGNPVGDIIWNTGQTAPAIIVDAPGNYTATVSNQYNCIAAAQTNVGSGESPLVDLGSNSIACDGEEILLDASADGESWVWNTGETTPQITVMATGTYSVEVANGACVGTDQVSFTFNPLPENTLVPDTTACFELPPYGIVLQTNNPGALYLWNTGSTDDKITIDKSGVYSVEITNQLGCSATYSTRVVNYCTGYTLYIPNAITPNNDGVNDVFQAIGSHVADFEMVIWDRWGQKVFETADMRDAWEGSVEGGDHYAPTDVYGYAVRFRYFDENGIVSSWQDLNGQVTVIR
jgi:gliding motility-associated-like protein